MKVPLLMALVLAAAGQWERVSVSTTASFRGLAVVSRNVIWASGTEGTVIRTADGGGHWSIITVPGAEKLDFRGIQAFDGTSAVVISSGPAEKGQARIYRTTDGGATWQLVFEEKRSGVFFDAIAFWDRTHGIVLSDPVDGRFTLFTTEDGGVTWKQIPPSALPPALPNEGAFAASNSCLTVYGDKNVWFASGGAGAARVFRSVDRGQHWTVAETPMRPTNASSGIFSLAFQDSRRGVAVGGDYGLPNGSGLPNTMVTSDGGQTWRAGAATDPPGMYLSAVAAGSAVHKGGWRQMWAAGPGGLYSANTVDSGPWTRQNDQGLNTVVYNLDGAWAAGPKGTVLQKGK